jgi:hypothetical protein
MRSILLHRVLLTVFVGTAGVAPADAQLVGSSFDACRVCLPQHCACTSFRPVVETRLRQEPVVTWRDVRQTAYRQELHCETVPVTRLETVTVDEGSYQTVWVPRPVTRQIARTDYQPRLSVRTVPVEVTQRVPQLSTRLVPEQTVRFMPHQTQAVFAPSAPRTCGTMLAPDQTGPGGRESAPAAPMRGSRIGHNSDGYDQSGPTLGEFGEATTVPVSAWNDLDEFDPVPRRAVRRRGEAADPSVKAPTAARVWQSQW